MRQLLIALALLAAPLAAAAPAASQAPTLTRAPAARSGLTDLAYVLGEAHGLAQVCDGQNQVWRSRMLRLIEVETPDEAFRIQLFDRFNTGFSAAQARHPRCGEGARAEAGRVAARGRDLARVIASAP